MKRLTSWFAKSKEALTSDQVTERINRIERALEAQLTEKQGSEVDRGLAEGVAALITALDKTPSAVIQNGTLLILKLPDRVGNSGIVVRQLNPRQLELLERRADLLLEPVTLLKHLSEISEIKADA